MRNGNPEPDSVSSHSNKCPEEINETYYKFNEENGTILLSWFHDFPTKGSKVWYILFAGFTALGPGLHNTLKLKSRVSHPNFNTLTWNICKTNTENEGLWIGQEVKAQFIELSVEITSGLWWPLRGRGSEGSTCCLPSTAFTLMKPGAMWKPIILKGQVYTTLQCTSLLKYFSREVPISVTLLYLIPLWFRNIFLRLCITLSKARNFTILSPINVKNHYQTFQNYLYS